jgi:hypothetical protein
MFFSSNSLVLIGAFSALIKFGKTVDDYGSTWRRHPGTTPHAVISAFKANTLGTGGTLPPAANPFTYRLSGGRLNPVAGGFAEPDTKKSVEAIQTGRQLPIRYRGTFI